jgi:tRNA(Leu) C34 or U34 (ribose-2'-O)-methylase TrmL
MKVVLFQPQIPQNTGNIVRTCAVTGNDLILVKPLGFSTSSRQLKRAGLDYWEGVKVSQIDNLETYLENLETEPVAELSAPGKIDDFGADASRHEEAYLSKVDDEGRLAAGQGFACRPKRAILTGARSSKAGSFYFFSSHATKVYTDIDYSQDDHLIFGSETAGLPPVFWERWPEKFYTLPMKPEARCLNLSNAVSIVTFEAWRQQLFSGASH